MNITQIQSAIEEIDYDINMLELKYDNMFSNPQAQKQKAALEARKLKLKGELCKASR